LKEWRKEFRSKRSLNRDENDEVLEDNSLTRDKIERVNREHDRQRKKEKSGKRSLDRASDRRSDSKSLRKGKLKIEDSSGTGKKYDRELKEARRKRFAQELEKQESSSRSRRR